MEDSHKVQLVGLMLLLAGVGLSWLVWGMPRSDRLDRAGKLLILTLVIAMVGGFAGAPFWWLDYPPSFPWDLPPLASRMLAAAAVSFGLAGLLVLQRPTTPAIRLYLTMLGVYLTPLVAVILLRHLNRFDWGEPITYAFFLLAGPLALSSLWHLVRRTPGPMAEEADVRPSEVCRNALLIIAMLSGIWGLAIFIVPAGPISAIWIWPDDALTSRLIATMLLTIAAMCLMARDAARLAMLALAILAVYGAGVALAGAMNAFSVKPLPIAYMAGLGSIAVIALVLRGKVKANG